MIENKANCEKQKIKTVNFILIQKNKERNINIFLLIGVCLEFSFKLDKKGSKTN